MVLVTTQDQIQIPCYVVLSVRYMSFELSEGKQENLKVRDTPEGRFRSLKINLGYSNQVETSEADRTAPGKLA